MADVASEALIHRLVAEVPALKPLYDDHVAFCDELLPYVFLSEVMQFVVEELAQSDARRQANAMRVLNLLDEAMESADESVVNLVAVGFVERHLGDEVLDQVRPALGPRLAAELASREQWRPRADCG